MSLKLNNQLAHLPNDISITRFEKHHSYLELFLSWSPDEGTARPCCSSHNCIGKGRSAVKTVYHIPIGFSATFLTFSLQRLFACGNVHFIKDSCSIAALRKAAADKSSSRKSNTQNREAQ